MSNECTYRRSLMEVALWGAFSRLESADPKRAEVPPVFLNRIKRLLELDAAEEAGVFSVAPPGGRGHAARYSAFGIFLMALALIFLDAGFKQSDALFILRHIKEQLRDPYHRALTSRPDLHQVVAASDRPMSPVDPDNRVLADPSIFMLLQKIEMRECWPGENVPDPFILGPTFCYGIAQLTQFMRTLGWQRPSKMVVELADMVVLIDRHIGRAEVLEAFERGSKKSERRSGNITPVKPSPARTSPSKGRVVETVPSAHSRNP